jgi:hypothetical protein
MAPVFSAVERGTLTIDPFVEANRTIDWSRRDGRYYSNKAPGPMILALPLYFIQHAAQRAAGVEDDAPRARDVALYVANAATSIAPTLLALALLWVVLVERIGATPGAAFLLAGTWALGSMSLPYSIVFMGHQTAAAFLAIGVCLSLIEMSREGGARPIRVGWAGLAMGMAAISDYLACALVAVWTIFIAWRDRRWLLPWILGGAGPAILAMAYHTACFGSPFTTAYNLRLLNPTFVPIAGWEAPRLSRLVDVTVRPWRGILYCTPVFALALVGFDRLRVEARRRPEMAAAAAGVVVYLLLLAAFPSAFGGACVGPRYFTAALPLCILLMAPAARILPRLSAVLAAVSAALMLAATLTDPLPDQSVRDPFRDRIFPLLTSGDPVPMRNLFTDLLGWSLPVAYFAYVGLWGACAVWLHLRLRAGGSAGEAAPEIPP